MKKTGRFKVCQNLEKDFKLINSNFYDELTKDHHRIKDGSFMIKITNKKKISIKNKFHSLPIDLEDTPYITVKLTRENNIVLNFEETALLNNLNFSNK